MTTSGAIDDIIHNGQNLKKVYVASSWRNKPYQAAVVAMVKSAGIGVYDFTQPKLHSDGFHWSEVVPSYVRGSAALITPDEYKVALAHPRAKEGFKLDFDAMKECDACILVLPCGASAHLELGWFIGQGKRTAIMTWEEQIQPELMYLMADKICTNTDDLLDWLGVEN